MKIGRNDLCSCGSGKKYKVCCLRKDKTPLECATGISPLDLQRFAAEIEAGGVKDEQELIDRLNARLLIESESANHAARDDFHGLSPSKMHFVLYQPFDAPGKIRFSPVLSQEPTALAAKLLKQLINILEDNPIKSTAKGNLPVKMVKSIVEQSRDIIDGEPGLGWIGTMRTEEDFSMLHKTRVVAGLAGLVLLRKKQFQLTSKCKQLIEQGGMKAVYPEFLKTYIKKFNWGFQDAYDELSFIQTSAMFTLYLFKRYSKQNKPNQFYEDAFTEAFPAVVDEIEEPRYGSKAVYCQHCYRVRVLERFAHFCGFIEMLPESNAKMAKHYKIRVLPLLDDWIQFTL